MDISEGIPLSALRCVILEVCILIPIYGENGNTSLLDVCICTKLALLDDASELLISSNVISVTSLGYIGLVSSHLGLITFSFSPCVIYLSILLLLSAHDNCQL